MWQRVADLAKANEFDTWARSNAAASSFSSQPFWPARLLAGCFVACRSKTRAGIFTRQIPKLPPAISESGFKCQEFDRK